MKRKITISFTSKRTIPLESFENYVPIHTITEEIELDEGEKYTTEDYQKDFLRIKRIVREQQTEEVQRTKLRQISYITAEQFTKIGLLVKEKKLDIDTEVKNMGFPSVGSLTAEKADELIHNLKNHE